MPGACLALLLIVGLCAGLALLVADRYARREIDRTFTPRRDKPHDY